MTPDHTFVAAPPLTPRDPRPTVADAKRRARVHVRSIAAEGTLLFVRPRAGRCRVRVDMSGNRRRYVFTSVDDCVVIDGTPLLSGGDRG